MPELPEVETIARALQNGGRGSESIVGKQIKTVHLGWQRSLEEPLPEIFYTSIKGQTISQVGRRGKFLVIQLSEQYLIFHLRMSGDLRVDIGMPAIGDSNPNPIHDRFWAVFQDGSRLVFNDPRKFGRIWLVDDPEKVYKNLGPEPLDTQLSPEMFHKRLSAYHRRIKALLLDQTFLAGMGNIYTDEALYRARIHPRMLSSQIDFEKAATLLQCIRDVLNEGILRNGASIDWVYRGGDFQNTFRVYQKTGETCQVCGETILRIMVGQRGTHFCPNCQPEPQE
jgi:formamidopyrimidine-DNA glycosylase